MSILFADILNSTAMLQHLDPEAAAELLDPPLEAMRSAVNRFDGVVSHLGDGILAVFGAPSACEDHAVRACLAALSMQDAMAKMAPVRARIGVHTGEVVMRERRIGRAQVWEPVGAALTVAARIEQSTEPGTISVSGVTADQARGFVETMPLPALVAKGFDQPLALARLIAAEPTANRWTVRSANGLLDMVDRTEHLQLLRTILEHEHGPGVHVVQIHGEPGVGKSRLLHEALRTVDATTAFVVRLSGDPHRQDAAFHAFAVWLRGWLDIRAGDSPESSRAALIERVRKTHTLTEQGESSLARLLGLGPASAAAAAAANQSDAAVEAPGALMALLRDAAGQRRLVLACEDLDCFDPASRDLLSSIAALTPDPAVVLLTTSRARIRLHGSGTSQLVHLLPLSRPDTLQLLCRIDRRFADQPGLAAALLEKTGGNPLFVEEIGAVAAANLADGAGDAWLQAEPKQLPDRVEALIADRLNRLPRALRRLVRLCAVIGDTVPLRLLARLSGTEEAALHKQLLRLQSEHVLTEARRYPDPEFAFRHALMREVAYRAILAGQRRELHRRACEVLEQQDASVSDSRVDDLCFHAVRAQDWAKAAVHLRGAAALASEKSAYQVARLRLDQALQASSRLPDTEERARDQLDMLLDRHLLLRAAGKYRDIEAVLGEIEQLAARVSDDRAIAHVMAHRVHLLNIAGRMGEAVALGTRACAAAETVGSRSLLVLASHNLAQAYYNQGNVRAAADAAANLAKMPGWLDDARRSGSIGSLPVMLSVMRSLALSFAGEDAEARDVADAARGEAEATGRPYDVAYAALASGLARTRAAPDEAADVLLDGIALCDTSQIAQAAPPLQAALGHLLLRSGDWSGAAAWLARAYAACLEQTRSMVMCWAAAGLARALWELDDRPTATRLAAEAVEVARNGGYRGYLTVALRLRAALLDAPEAAASLREAEALAIELGLSGELADCRRALAGLNG